jgi:SAM-dependent methyltransferase
MVPNRDKHVPDHKSRSPAAKAHGRARRLSATLDSEPGLDTASLEQDPGLMAAVARELGPNALGFLKRVYRDGLSRYQARIKAVGLSGREHVLDAGCGLGQWSLVLARDCGRATGIDLARERVAVCRLLAQAARCDNAHFVAGSLEALPFGDRSFDGLLSYSVVYFTDYRRTFAEFHRVLRSGGLLYVSTNAIGRYLYDVVRNPNPAADFNPRRYGVRSLVNTFLGRRQGLSAERGTAAMSHRGTRAALAEVGFEVLALGPEGSLGAGGEPFQFGRYLGLPGVFDVLARRR